MEKDTRTIEIHCFKTNQDTLKIKLRCRYRHFRDDTFAYYIVATPLIKRAYDVWHNDEILLMEQRYEQQEMYATTLRYNKRDLQRVSEQIKKAAEDFEQNVYNNSPAAYHLGLVLHAVLHTVKQRVFPVTSEPLRVITQDDKPVKGPRKCRTQKFKCSVPK